MSIGKDAQMSTHMHMAQQAVLASSVHGTRARQPRVDARQASKLCAAVVQAVNLRRDSMASLGAREGDGALMTESEEARDDR